MAKYSFTSAELTEIRGMLFSDISMSANWAPLTKDFKPNDIDKNLAANMNRRLKNSIDNISDSMLARYAELRIDENNELMTENWVRISKKIGTDSAPDTAQDVIEKFVLDWGASSTPNPDPAPRRRAIRI